LVPPQPNELTPASAGASSGAGHGSSAVGTRIASPSNGISGFSGSACRLAGTCRCCIASTVFSSPAIPAAPSVCPMFVFAEPTSSRRSGDRAPPSTAPSAASSI
jgi:hypothetical protein